MHHDGFGAISSSRCRSMRNRSSTATSRRAEHWWCMEELWAFLFTGFGAFVGLTSLALVIGVAVLVWWSRKID
jgi:hypothetical protein